MGLHTRNFRGINFGQNYTITPTIAQNYFGQLNKQSFRDKKYFTKSQKDGTMPNNQRQRDDNEDKLCGFEGGRGIVRVARLQNEVGTKYFFRGTTFLTKTAPDFSPKFLSLYSVGQKKSRLISRQISVPKIKKKSPKSFCRIARRRNWGQRGESPKTLFFVGSATTIKF